MLIRVFIWSMLFAFHGNALAQNISNESVITGVYKGKSLFIQNTFNPASQSFCIKEVQINRLPVDLNYQLSALEINFSGVDLYTPVSVHIISNNDCEAKILNPDAILFHSSFNFSELYATDTTLVWEARGEKEDGIFIIEKLEDNRWNALDTIISKGDFVRSVYEIFVKFSIGANKYRIKYLLTTSGRYLYSKEIEYTFYPQPIRFWPSVTRDKLFLSRYADYDILDIQGNSLFSGSGKEINVKQLKPGSYLLYVDEHTEIFTKQ